MKHFFFRGVSMMDLLSVRQDKILLFDFYGSLLTEKQRAIFEMRTVDDLSLTEIGKEFGVTPQAVVDIVKRTYAKLEKYEKNLGLVKKYKTQEQTLEEIETVLGKLEGLGWTEINSWAGEIRESLDKLVSYGI